MTAQVQSSATPRPANHPRDLQARLYREIGISAVAAALRFTTQPEPVSKPVDSLQGRTSAARDDRAA